MSVRPFQDPIADAGRRAALAGHSIATCPYPEGSVFAGRWRAAFRDALQARGPGLAQAMKQARPEGFYSVGETERILSMLEAGAEAPEIAAALGRPEKSVRGKIGALSAEVGWGLQQSRALIQLASQGLNAPDVAARLGTTESAVRGRASRLGVRFIDRRFLARAGKVAAE
jgi:DNA-binding NarL/FixJ family response regulator